MPYMSPAAIGWMAVIPRGLPFSRKCFPIDLSEASGHPNPLEELTVTTALSAISSPIFSIGIILDRNIVERDGLARKSRPEAAGRDFRASGCSCLKRGIVLLASGFDWDSGYDNGRPGSGP